MMRRWFPGVFQGSQLSQEINTTEKEDLMMLDPTYQALQRAEEELGKWKTGVEGRDELLRQAYREIQDLRIKLEQWTAGMQQRDILLTAAYKEIVEKNQAIREVKERVSAVDKVATEVGSPGEPPEHPARAAVVTTDQGQEPAHEDELTGPPAPPQRLPDEEATEHA